MVAEKSRVKNLSTRYLRFYKHSVSGMIILIMAVFLYYEFKNSVKVKPSMFFWPFYYGYFLYLWWKLNQRVYHVEFDQEFMYIAQRDQDLVLPLENIKDVNLVSIGGVYKVELYTKELFGDTFYFKPSLWYPFNHKNKEAMVDILWANIEKAKSKKQHFQSNALHS